MDEELKDGKITRAGIINYLPEAGIMVAIRRHLQPLPSDEPETLSDKVKELEERMEAVKKELNEARATMLVNFGPNGRTIPGMLKPEDRLSQMIVVLCRKENLEELLKKV